MDLYKQLLRNYRFRVSIDGKEAAFSKISGLSMDIDTEMIAEGGYNYGSYIAMIPMKNAKTMRMQKGVCNDQLLIKLCPGIILTKGIVVMVLDGNGEIVIKYATEQALVTKWELSELDATSGQILIDTFEVAYTGLKIMK